MKEYVKFEDEKCDVGDKIIEYVFNFDYFLWQSLIF